MKVLLLFFFAIFFSFNVLAADVTETVRISADFGFEKCVQTDQGQTCTFSNVRPRTIEVALEALDRSDSGTSTVKLVQDGYELAYTIKIWRFCTEKGQTKYKFVASVDVTKPGDTKFKDSQELGAAVVSTSVSALDQIVFNGRKVGKKNLTLRPQVTISSQEIDYGDDWWASCKGLCP